MTFKGELDIDRGRMGSTWTGGVGRKSLCRGREKKAGELNQWLRVAWTSMRDRRVLKEESFGHFLLKKKRGGGIAFNNVLSQKFRIRNEFEIPLFEETGAQKSVLNKVTSLVGQRHDTRDSFFRL